MNALIVIDPQNDFALVARWRLLAVTTMPAINTMMMTSIWWC